MGYGHSLGHVPVGGVHSSHVRRYRYQIAQKAHAQGEVAPDFAKELLKNLFRLLEVSGQEIVVSEGVEAQALTS